MADDDKIMGPPGGTSLGSGLGANGPNSMGNPNISGMSHNSVGSTGMAGMQPV